MRRSPLHPLRLCGDLVQLSGASPPDTWDCPNPARARGAHRAPLAPDVARRRARSGVDGWPDSRGRLALSSFKWCAIGRTGDYETGTPTAWTCLNGSNRVGLHVAGVGGRGGLGNQGGWATKKSWPRLRTAKLVRFDPCHVISLSLTDSSTLGVRLAAPICPWARRDGALDSGTSLGCLTSPFPTRSKCLTSHITNEVI